MKVPVTDGWRVGRATSAAAKKSQYWNEVPNCIIEYNSTLD